ncbi:MAG: hypothetical protein V1794_17500 [Candidatus Glassbacteria bacterium]
MNWLLLFIVALVIIYIIAKSFRGSVKYSAVQNAFYAKYTYDQLSDIQKEQVKEKTLQIMIRGGLLEEDFHAMSEMLRFSYYALAMNELNIPPALKNEEWHYVRNPYMALHNSEHQIQVVKSHLTRKHNVQIEFEKRLPFQV